MHCFNRGLQLQQPAAIVDHVIGPVNPLFAGDLSGENGSHLVLRYLISGYDTGNLPLGRDIDNQHPVNRPFQSFL